MNYIKHLNSWFDILKSKPETTPTHIALYLVLFQLWNQNRFASSFGINRQDIVNLSKLGSFSTYSKCMKDLHAWGWIVYRPTRSKYGVSQVSIVPYQQLTKHQAPITTTFVASNNNASDPTPSSDPSSTTSTDLRKKQEVGQLLKQQNEKEKITNETTTHLTNKFYEPL